MMFLSLREDRISFEIHILICLMFRLLTD